MNKIYNYFILKYLLIKDKKFLKECEKMHIPYKLYYYFNNIFLDLETFFRPEHLDQQTLNYKLLNLHILNSISQLNKVESYILMIYYIFNSN